MALETDVSGTVNEVKTVSTATTKVRVRSVWFYYEAQVAILELSLGNVVNGDFVPVSTELWTLKGPDFVSVMTGAPNGNTSANVIRNLLVQMVTFIQGNSVKKQELLASGDLHVQNGSFTDFIPHNILTKMLS